MAVTAAAAGLDPEHVATRQHVAVRQGRQAALVVGAGIAQDAARATGHAPRDAPRRIFHAVDADRQYALFGQDVVFAHDAAATAIASGPTRVGEDAVAPQPHRVAVLQELD